MIMFPKLMWNKRVEYFIPIFQDKITRESAVDYLINTHELEDGKYLPDSLAARIYMVQTN